MPVIDWPNFFQQLTYYDYLYIHILNFYFSTYNFNIYNN